MGVTFFPRIFADVEAAESSVHILMFGWREGEIGMEMAALLRRKLAEGVDMIGRILAAAQRGVAVRLVVSQTSNNTQATAALQHYYGALAEAGVELWELPGTVVHAKVVVADDVVSFCTVNLDAWALYRYNAIMMLAQSAETAELLEERPFEPDISRSQRGVPPEGARERFESRLWSALGSFL